MANISYIGLKSLTELEAKILKDIVENEQKRIFRPKHKLEFATLSVSVKVTNEQGERKLYTIALKLSSPSTKRGVFEVKTNGWDFEKTLHSSFDALYNLLLHRLKVKRGGSYKNV